MVGGLSEQQDIVRAQPEYNKFRGQGFPSNHNGWVYKGRDIIVSSNSEVSIDILSNVSGC